MLTLIIILISGIVVALFATQNTQLVSVSFLSYGLSEVPLYILVLIALVSGIFISWLLSRVDAISSYLAFRGQERKISDGKKESTNLIKQVHQLELENEKLKAELHRSGDEKSI
jgi:uncharacterized integral membrane protein